MKFEKFTLIETGHYKCHQCDDPHDGCVIEENSTMNNEFEGFYIQIYAETLFCQKCGSLETATEANLFERI